MIGACVQDDGRICRPAFTRCSMVQSKALFGLLLHRWLPEVPGSVAAACAKLWGPLG